MAAPHVAGAVALLLSSGVARDAREAKAALLASAVPLRAAGEEPGSARLDAPSTQGAGRIQLDSLLSYPPHFEPSTVTLATNPAETPGVAHAFEAVVSNPGARDVMLSFRPEGARSVAITAPEAVVIPAGKTRALTFTATLDDSPSRKTPAPMPTPLPFPLQPGSPSEAPFAFVAAFDADGARVAGFPVAFSPRGPSGARVEVRRSRRRATSGFELSNAGRSEAMALPYARWLEDPREDPLPGVSARGRGHGACDLQGISLRVLEPGLLQAAIVLNEAVSTFALCEPSLLLDTDGDGVRDFEITAAKATDLAPSSFGFLGTVFSFLLDPRRVREIRARFDAGWTPSAGAAPDYADAVVDLQDSASFVPGRVIVLSADLAKVTLSKEARIAALLRNATEPVARAIDTLGGVPLRKEPDDGDALPWHAFELATLTLPKSLGDVLIPAGGEARLGEGIALPPGLVFVVPSNAGSQIVLRSR